MLNGEKTLKLIQMYKPIIPVYCPAFVLLNKWVGPQENLGVNLYFVACNLIYYGEDMLKLNQEARKVFLYQNYLLSGSPSFQC